MEQVGTELKIKDVLVAVIGHRNAWREIGVSAHRGRVKNPLSRYELASGPHSVVGEEPSEPSVVS